jgi:hypothetical protein
MGVIWVSDEIDVDAEASELQLAIDDWYNGQTGLYSAITVTKEYWDASEVVTTDTTQIVTTVYTVTLSKFIDYISAANIIKYAWSTSPATVVARMPGSGLGPTQRSDPPLTGSFIIECYDA